MFVVFIKFLHIVFMLILFSTVLFNFAYNLTQKNANTLVIPDYIGTAAALFALFTGGFLITPKGYQVTTPWITLAFILVTTIITLIGFSVLVKSRKNKQFNILLTLNYSIMIVCLIGLVHDAVSKHTIWQ